MSVCLHILGEKGAFWPHYTPSAYNLVYWTNKSCSMQYRRMGRLFGAGNLNKVFSVTVFKF